MIFAFSRQALFEKGWLCEGTRQTSAFLPAFSRHLYSVWKNKQVQPGAVDFTCSRGLKTDIVVF